MNILNNSELNKLYQIEDILEKNIANIIKRFRDGEQCFTSDITDAYENTYSARFKQLQDVKNHVQKIMLSLKSKTDLLQHSNLQDINDFDKFKKEMIDIQESILNFKEGSKEELRNMKQISENLNNELNMYYNEKVQEWSENCNINVNSDVSCKIKIKNTEECKEVKKFLDFVYQSGGHENGWPKEDHLLFVKYRTRYKNIDDVARYVHETLPDISIERTKEHYEWYSKYSDLKSKKKKAILMWKQKRNCSTVKNIDNEQSDYKKQLENDDSDNEKLRKKLQQWKSEKEEKLKLEKLMQQDKFLEQIERERLERQKQLQVKQLVDEWKESKIVYEQCREEMKKTQEEHEKKRKALLANKLIKKYQSLDELHISKMRQINQKMTKLSMQRVKSGPAAMRNPQRLLQPTIQWTHKVKSLKDPANQIVPITMSSKLAVPEWRKNLS